MLQAKKATSKLREATGKLQAGAPNAPMSNLQPSQASADGKAMPVATGLASPQGEDGSGGRDDAACVSNTQVNATMGAVLPQMTVALLW